mgnify:CR=1 FL=1
MHIRVIILDSLVRYPDSNSTVPLAGLEYWDRRSTTSAEALETVWRICNAAPTKLTETELALRDVWDAAAGGLGLSVGDVVEVDGKQFRCTEEGWAAV